MILPFVSIYEAPSYDVSLLEIAPISDEDLEYYELGNWQYYRPDYLLPSLGERLHFSGRQKQIVVEIKGRRYKVEVESDYNEEPYEVDGKSLVLTETDEPLTVEDSCRGWYQFFGQPNWIQNKTYPSDLLGNPCHHFLTVENGWGDCGNWNILLGFDKDGVPNIAYFEASCC